MQADNEIVDSVGQLADGQELCYVLWDQERNLFVAASRPRGVVLTCSVIHAAERFPSRAKSAIIRGSCLSQPNRWQIVPAVYDSRNGTLMPIGG